MKTIARISALLLAVTVYGEPFEVMIAPTRQDAAMDWWYAVPEGFAPQLSLVSSVAKGEYFNILPLFSNYAVDTNQNARITYDIEVLRPDGSTDEAIRSCDGHDGTAAPPNLLPARAVMRICFDPEDPYGEYVINVTGYDHISNQTNRQSVTVEQKAFRLEPLTEKERDELFFRYSTAPNPSLAAASFLQTVQPFFNEDHELIWSAIWFFKTVFENNEFLIPHLVEAFETATLKQQKDLLLVFALMGRTAELPELSPELKAYNRALKSRSITDPYSEITTANQLDMLWAEFFATGSIKPIRQLVTSLNLSPYEGTLDKLAADELDPKDPKVRRAAKLDAVFQSALWSLRTNCEPSPLLYSYCIGILQSEELEKPAQACLAMLLKVVTEQQEEKL
jgi:hypothetical protein